MSDVPTRRATQSPEDWWSTSIIDMKPGAIRYRGYAIEELIGRVGFAEMVYLMTRGELPHPEAAKLKKLRATRDQAKWKAALDNLKKVSQTNENVMPTVIEAVKAKATVGEICDVWREIFGEYRPKEFV